MADFKLKYKAIRPRVKAGRIVVFKGVETVFMDESDTKLNETGANALRLMVNVGWILEMVYTRSVLSVLVDIHLLVVCCYRVESLFVRWGCRCCFHFLLPRKARNCTKSFVGEYRGLAQSTFVIGFFLCQFPAGCALPELNSGLPTFKYWMGFYDFIALVFCMLVLNGG